MSGAPALRERVLCVGWPRPTAPRARRSWPPSSTSRSSSVSALPVSERGCWASAVSGAEREGVWCRLHGVPPCAPGPRRGRGGEQGLSVLGREQDRFAGQAGRAGGRARCRGADARGLRREQRGGWRRERLGGREGGGRRKGRVELRRIVPAVMRERARTKLDDFGVSCVCWPGCRTSRRLGTRGVLMFYATYTERAVSSSMARVTVKLTTHCVLRLSPSCHEDALSPRSRRRPPRTHTLVCSHAIASSLPVPHLSSVPFLVIDSEGIPIVIMSDPQSHHGMAPWLNPSHWQLVKRNTNHPSHDDEASTQLSLVTVVP
eukprot:1208029-Rhodomonas_salina.1